MTAFLYALGAVIVLASALAVVVAWWVWTVETQIEIDINSGRLRTSKRCLGISYDDRIQTTDFSRLANQLGLAESPPEWRIVSVRSKRNPFSPQFTFQRMPTELECFMLICRLQNIEGPAKEATARDLMKALKQSDPVRVCELVREFERTMMGGHDGAWP